MPRRNQRQYLYQQSIFENFEQSDYLDSYSSLGVNHAFHNDTGRRYVEEQATQAWLDTLAWFEKHMKQR